MFGVDLFLVGLYGWTRCYTVCPGSSDPPGKIFNIFASENEAYTIFKLLRYVRVNIIRFRSHELNGIK